MDYLGSSLDKLKKKKKKTKEHAKPYHRSVICKFRLGKTTIGKQPGFLNR